LKYNKYPAMFSMKFQLELSCATETRRGLKMVMPLKHTPIMDDQMTQIDYLVVGHICSDLTPEGSQVGGTVAYSGRTAQALGCKAAVLTSAASDYDLDQTLFGIKVHTVCSPCTTTFENVYTESGRVQKIHCVAQRLCIEDLPEQWRQARIVHLGPVANEIEPEIIHRFEKSLVGLTPQGWMRYWNGSGYVRPRNWPFASDILPFAEAVILSEEDILNDEILADFRKLSRLLVLTRGSRGCTVFYGKKTKHIPTIPVENVNPTGAGDIFAAAFLVRLEQTGGEPWEAAEFANRIAAATVNVNGLEAKVARIRQLVGKSL